jgi:hypothetical protein
MDDRLIAIVRGFLMLGVVLAVAALIDAYRSKRSPGLHPPKKLTRRELYWIILIVIILVLLGFPVGGLITPPRSDNRPITISDK